MWSGSASDWQGRNAPLSRARWNAEVLRGGSCRPSPRERGRGPCSGTIRRGLHGREVVHDRFAQVNPGGTKASWNNSAVCRVRADSRQSDAARTYGRTRGSAQGRVDMGVPSSFEAESLLLGRRQFVRVALEEPGRPRSSKSSPVPRRIVSPTWTRRSFKRLVRFARASSDQGLERQAAEAEVKAIVEQPQDRAAPGRPVPRAPLVQQGGARERSRPRGERT